MRIVHVGKYYPPYRGGIETVVELIGTGLARRGADVTVVVSNDARGEREERQAGVHIIRLPRVAEISSQPLNPALIRTLRSLRSDVLHFHTPNPIGSLAILAARCGVPIVVTHHSDIVRQRVLGGMATAAHALLYRQARAIVAPTPRHIEHSNILGRFRNKCRVIHLPIDVRPHENAVAMPDSELPLGFAGRPLALFVGRLVYYKGLDVLLSAVARVPELRLIIVGVGPLRSALIDQTRVLQLSDRVAFLDGVSAETLVRLYRSSNFLVLPSVARSEAFGMVQLEAMASSRAVISTDLPFGVPYVNQHEVTGLVVPPNDVDGLATAIRRLVRDPAYAVTLGLNGQRRAREEFGIDRVVDQHVMLYEELCGRSAFSAASRVAS